MELTYIPMQSKKSRSPSVVGESLSWNSRRLGNSIRVSGGQVRFEDKTLVLGIGAQKAGTTWLYRYLRSHGEIYMSPQKELHYFDVKFRPELCAGVEDELARRLKHLRDHATAKQNVAEQVEMLETRLSFGENPGEYVRLFRERVPEAVGLFGEITPSYALLPEEGFRQLRRLFRHIRLIFIMRDPVERFYSQIRQEIDVGQAVNYVPAIRKRMRDPTHSARSFYRDTITAMEAVFDAGNIHYEFYESLFCEASVRRLCDFLGIAYRPAKFDRVVNASEAQEEIPAAVDRRVRRIFQPTIDFCRERFGSAVPATWNEA